MHGTVMHGFKQFVRQRYGEPAWNAIVEASGAGGWYLSTQPYPDEELVWLLKATSTRTGSPVSSILEEFGVALVPTLLALYRPFIEPAWRTMDLLERTEAVIHRTVRLRDPSASPPRLRTKRVSQGEVHIEYDSIRRLCALAVGICKGLASNYREEVSIEQPECMEKGDPACRLIVKLT